MSQHENEEMDEKELIHKMAGKVDKMYTYVCGDEKGGVTGLVERVVKLEEKLAEFERLKWKLMGIASVAAPVVLFAWELFKRWVTKD
jgi:hypothetical protein